MKLRRDIDDPILQKSSSDKALPMRVMPKTESVDPRRMKLLRDKDEPSCEKDSTDKEEPSLTRP
jgi:hypothetical protein